MNHWTETDDVTKWMLGYILLEDAEVTGRKYVAFSEREMNRKPPPIPNFIIIIQTTMASTATGRQTGAKGYSRDEVRHLLDILERRLPVGPEEWDACVQDHAVAFAGRDLNSIRRKYSSLHRKNIPTGDPNMPPEVRQAKRIKHLIGRRVDIGDGEEVYQLQQNAFQATGRQRAESEGLGVVEDVNDENPSMTQYPHVPMTQPSQTQEEEDIEPPPAPRKAPPPATETPPPMASSVSSFSSARNTVRPYSRRNASQEDFLDLFRLQMQQQQEARNEEAQRLKLEAQERKEDRQLFMQGLTTFMGAVGSYLGNKDRKRKGKRKRSDSDSDSD